MGHHVTAAGRSTQESNHTTAAQKNENPRCQARELQNDLASGPEINHFTGLPSPLQEEDLKIMPNSASSAAVLQALQAMHLIPVMAPADHFLSMIPKHVYIKGGSLDPIPTIASTLSGYQLTLSSQMSAQVPTIVRPSLTLRPVETLTASLNTADCPETARRLYRILFEIALETVRARGLAVMPTVAVFHLPSELLAAHAQVSRETVWRNLKPLMAAGVLDAKDHYGTLRGQTSVTGKVWAISLRPEAQIARRADPVKVTAKDLRFAWRDLDADAQVGRTVYNLTRTDERQAHDAAKAAEREPFQAEARARASARKSARQSDTRAGKKPLKGRAAATMNAAETRAARADMPPSAQLQQSEKRRLNAVEQQELRRWALTPFSPDYLGDTLTVAASPASGLDAIFSLPSLTSLSRRERGAAVEKTARSLAATFEDTKNMRFWCWLLWQMLRGADQGQNWSDDVSLVLARVLQDMKHDETMNNRTVQQPGALVAAGLKVAGLLDALRTLTPTRVGVRPKIRVA